MINGFRERQASRVALLEIDARASFQLLVITLVSLFMIGCGRSTTEGSAANSGTKMETKVSPSSQNTGSQNRSAFDAAKTLSLANDQHPWDGLPKTPAKPVVANGDEKPPELSRNSVVSCAERQPNRCVSCCDDFFSFGSGHWDQCVNACPKLGVDIAGQSEY